MLPRNVGRSFLLPHRDVLSTLRWSGRFDESRPIQDLPTAPVPRSHTVLRRTTTAIKIESQAAQYADLCFRRDVTRALIAFLVWIIFLLTNQSRHHYKQFFQSFIVIPFADRHHEGRETDRQNGFNVMQFLSILILICFSFIRHEF